MKLKTKPRESARCAEVQSLEGMKDRLRWSERRERLRSAVLDLLAKETPLHEILAVISERLERYFPDLLCSVVLMGKSGKPLKPLAAKNPLSLHIMASDIAEIGVGVPSMRKAKPTNRGKRMEEQDIVLPHDCCRNCLKLAYDSGPGFCQSEPLPASSGEILGVFLIYRKQNWAEPENHQNELIRLAIELARIAIEHWHVQAKLQLASLVYRAIGEAVMVADADNRIIAINPVFTRLTGYTEQEAIGQTTKLLKSGRNSREFYQGMWHSLNTAGQWQGEIWNRRKNGDEYPEWLSISTIYAENGGVLGHVAMFSDITDQKRAEDIVWRQANFDPLTQLPNRRLFYDRLEQEIKKAHRGNVSFAVLFIDLDRFKEVNDTLGHDMGDKLLAEAGRRIVACVRDSDTVARLGGDEFILILNDVAEAQRVQRVAEAVIQTLSDPFQLDDETVYVSASMGITFYPEDATNVEGLLKNADQAMYVAKSEGRNRFSRFTNGLQEKAVARQQLVKDLRVALETGQFSVHFQPIMEFASGRIAKAEALLRWRHPLRGMVSPAEFIPLAEETGLINPIGNWVLQEAVRWLKQWIDLCPKDFKISVNKSPVQFLADGNHHETWCENLEKLDIPGQNLIVEITEGLLLNADSAVMDKLLKFRDAGIQVAIDDFGTGYSSLSYLKKLHIDYLKIDQSFVRHLETDPANRALSEAIIVMAHKLGLKVIAEGVETPEQRDLLSAAGCDFGQGYLFAKPMPGEQFEALLSNPSLLP
ncbi:MAG TPA: EAL domain-containing protein [Methylococcaceae bacterium]|nr:EAL domain-containing protein [Methylococcaceae bacterium]